MNHCNPKIHVKWFQSFQIWFSHICSWLSARENYMFTYQCRTKDKKMYILVQKIISCKPCLSSQLWNVTSLQRSRVMLTFKFLEKLRLETVITINNITECPAPMTHPRFAFCLKMKRNLNDQQHAWNTQLLKAICYKAEQSTRSWLQPLSVSTETQVLNNKSDVPGVMIFKGSLAIIRTEDKRDDVAGDGLILNSAEFLFHFQLCLSKHSPLNTETHY